MDGGMAEYELVVRARRAVTPDGIRPVAVGVRDGRIAAVAGFADALDAAAVAELPDQQVLLPGLVDTHVHVNEPGRTEWEGFHTATRAAAAGGITTIADMPLNSSPVTTSVAALEEKLHAVGGQLWVDCGFWGGLIPDNAESLDELLDAGVAGVKAFLVPSGIDEFPMATER